MPLATKDIWSLGEVVSEERQLQALVEVLDSINCHKDLQELFHDLAARLRRLVFFDSLHNPVRDVIRISTVETTSPVTLPVGLEIAKDDSGSWHVPRQVRNKRGPD